MNKATKVRTIAELLCLCAAAGASLALTAVAQTAAAPGALELVVRATPTAGRAEPVRESTFYLLTKSYTQIVKDIEGEDKLPTKEEFIDGLKVSKEMRDWLKAHDTLDLTEPGLDRRLSPDEVLQVPEFLLAYQRSNSGGVTHGLPKPKFKEADKKDNPERYAKQYQEYMAALRKFMIKQPETMTGIELELSEVSPQNQWDKIHADHAKRIEKLAPELAQTKYLAGKTDTDLDGHAALSGIAPSNYWISTLNLEAIAGDARLRWDVPVTIQSGQTTRVELTNLNSTSSHSANSGP